MMTGAGPFGPIEMGGMFTVVKVREGLDARRLHAIRAGTSIRPAPSPRGEGGKLAMRRGYWRRLVA